MTLFITVFKPIELINDNLFVSAEDAVEKLLELSPFDLKRLLHLIFSCREFTVDESKHAPGCTDMPWLLYRRARAIQTCTVFKTWFVASYFSS